MRYETSVVVNRPIDEVWAFLTDAFNIPRLSGTTLGFRPAPGQRGPVGVGTAFQMRLVILGFEARASATFTEWEPPHALAFSGRGAGMRSLSLRQILEATADGTRVVRVFEYEPGPILKLLWPIVGPWFRRRHDAGTRNIKQVLEANRG